MGRDWRIIGDRCDWLDGKDFTFLHLPFPPSIQFVEYFNNYTIYREQRRKEGGFAKLQQLILSQD